MGEHKHKPVEHKQKPVEHKHKPAEHKPAEHKQKPVEHKQKPVEHKQKPSQSQGSTQANAKIKELEELVKQSLKENQKLAQQVVQDHKQIKQLKVNLSPQDVPKRALNIPAKQGLQVLGEEKKILDKELAADRTDQG